MNIIVGIVTEVVVRVTIAAAVMVVVVTQQQSG